MEWTLLKYSESHGMSSLFLRITKTVPSLFRGIFSERNFDGNLTYRRASRNCLTNLWLVKNGIIEQARLNPYKIGPSGAPIKNGLLGHFPTLRKDDADVESSRPPPLPLPGPVGYVKVGGRFSAFSWLRNMLNSKQNTVKTSLQRRIWTCF